MIRAIGLQHTHPYSWFAQAADAAGRKAVGDALIPILRVRKDEKTRNFDPLNGQYRDTVDISRAVDQPDWWRKAGPQMDEWRNALATGNLTALRLFRDDETKNGSTGRWLGIYRINTVKLDRFEICVDLEPKRIWDIRT